MKTKIENQCFEFICAVKQYGFSFAVSGTTVKLAKNFTPNDKGAYCLAEDNAYRILDLAPRTAAGSIWGSDSGSIGGAIAISSGKFVMNKSGVSSRFVKTLSKFTNV